MPQVRIRVEPRRIIVSIIEFKANSRKLLPPNHPLLTILKKTPDRLEASELDHKLDDWIALLEG